MNKNKPIETFRDGRLSAALWRNTNGQGDVWYTVTTTLTYKDAGGDLRDTNSIPAKDIPRSIELQREARQHAMELIREAREKQRAVDKEPAA